jgi:biopolymer transport protein ExbD
MALLKPNLPHVIGRSGLAWGRTGEGDLPMALSVGNENGPHAVMCDMNTTPLIDVMLVLLVMFIVTIPIQTHAVKLDLPRGGQPPVDAPRLAKYEVVARTLADAQRLGITNIGFVGNDQYVE